MNLDSRFVRLFSRQISQMIGILTSVVLTLVACQPVARDRTASSSAEPTEVNVTMTAMFYSTREPDQVTPVPLDKLRQRWLTGIPSCRPPCWEGIVPGQTSAMEAAETLSRNPAFSEVELDKSPLPNDRTGHLTFKMNAVLADGTISLWGGDALFDYTTPDQIIYVVRLHFPEMQMGDLIRVRGEPSHVMAFSAPTPDIEDESYVWELDMLWLRQGLAMHHAGDFTEPKIDEHLIFKQATYFPPTLEGYGKATSLFYAEHVRLWHGYGDFDSYFESSPEQGE